MQRPPSPPNTSYDAILASLISKQENALTTLNEVRDQAQMAYVSLLQAQEDRRPASEINRLQNIHERLQSELERAEVNFKDHGTNLTAITSAAAQKKTSTKYAYHQPLRSFSISEITKINHHYERLPGALKLLIDRALLDENISLELMANPVFIRGDGHVYDFDVVNKMLDKNNPSRFLHDDSKSFSYQDVIPCNTLIQAMDQLLNIINGSEPKPVLRKKLFVPYTDLQRDGFSEQHLHVIEKGYQALLDRQKVLFDIICRDALTGVIMVDPVLLPDGYVYDRSTVEVLLGLAQLQHKDKYPCPQNENVKFGREDITRCYFVVSVLKQLKENVEMAMGKAIVADSEKKFKL